MNGAEQISRQIKQPIRQRQQMEPMMSRTQWHSNHSDTRETLGFKFRIIQVMPERRSGSTQ